MYLYILVWKFKHSNIRGMEKLVTDYNKLLHKESFEEPESAMVWKKTVEVLAS